MDEPTYRLNLDALGIFWVAFCCSWTAILMIGMGFLWLRREMPLVKVRGIRLSLSAITCLHVYWIAVQLAYIVSPFPNEAQYWIMGIYLPFGIALFHASNSRFLYIANKQRSFVQESREKSSSRTAIKLGRLQIRLDHTRKVLAIIGIGMLVQVRALLSVAKIQWLTSAACPDRYNVPFVPQIPPFLWRAWNRSGRQSLGGQQEAGHRLGMVRAAIMIRVLASSVG